MQQLAALVAPDAGLIGRIVTAFGFPNPVLTDMETADAATRDALVASLPYVVATLHTLFNVINTLVLIWFIPQIEKIVKWLVPSQEGEKESFRLKYISGGPLGTAELSINEARQEIVNFGRICYKGFGYIRQAVNEQDVDKFEKLTPTTSNTRSRPTSTK